MLSSEQIVVVNFVIISIVTSTFMYWISSLAHNSLFNIVSKYVPSADVYNSSGHRTDYAKYIWQEYTTSQML